MIWRAHGTPAVWHLTSEWRRDMSAEYSYDPVCGIEKPETVTRPDGHQWCRHCIAREGKE